MVDTGEGTWSKLKYDPEECEDEGDNDPSLVEQASSSN